MGAGCALEGATRGLKVAVVDGDDFAAGTSGRSTKLIHGGIRYLEQAVFSLDYSKLQLVVEALHERAHLLNAAPYMAHPVPIMIPLYKWWELPYMYAGAKAYDIFAWGKRAVPASQLILKVRDAAARCRSVCQIKQAGARGGQGGGPRSRAGWDVGFWPRAVEWQGRVGALTRACRPLLAATPAHRCSGATIPLLAPCRALPSA